MMFFARVIEGTGEKPRSWWERRQERRLQRIADDETARIKEAFKFLLPRAHAAECINAAINMLAVDASDLQIDDSIPQSDTAILTAEYAALLDEAKVLREKIMTVYEHNDAAHRAAEAKRGQAYRCDHGHANELDCPTCGH